MGPEQTKQRSPLKPILLAFALIAAAVVAIPAIGMVRILAHWSVKDASPPPAIGELLRDSFGLELPVAAIVNSARLPNGMDSAGVYELDLPPSADFLKKLKSSAQSHNWKVTAGYAPTRPDLPAWWKPQSIPDLIWIEIQHPNGAAYYTIGHSPAESGTLLIYWFTT